MTISLWQLSIIGVTYIAGNVVTPIFQAEKNGFISHAVLQLWRRKTKPLRTQEICVPIPHTEFYGHCLSPMMLPSGSLTLAIFPQLTAFFTSALILASSVAVNSFSAKAVGHRAPSARFAVSLKPNVAC